MNIVVKVAKWLGLILLVIAVIALTLYLIYVRPVLAELKQTEEIQYDKNLTILKGGGGNSGILVSDSVIIVIDTKMGDASVEMGKQVKDLAGSKPIVVINTHYHYDHTEGNEFYPGQTIVAGAGYTRETWLTQSSEEDLPTQWLKDRMDIKTDDDTVTIFTLNMTIHTAGDVFVYLHNRKMLFGGDVILEGHVPSVMNGDPQGYLQAFDILQQQWDIQKIVPGHGRIGGIEILEDFRQYFLDMKLAAVDKSQRSAIVSKYKGWTQVPLLMSSDAVIRRFEERAVE